jgi:hypothetical protein
VALKDVTTQCSNPRILSENYQQRVEDAVERTNEANYQPSPWVENRTQHCTGGAVIIRTAQVLGDRCEIDFSLDKLDKIRSMSFVDIMIHRHRSYPPLLGLTTFLKFPVPLTLVECDKRHSVTGKGGHGLVMP